MNRKKKLPVSEPLTSTWLYDAYPLSVLAANGDKYLGWFMSNFIQVNANKDITNVKRHNVFLKFDGAVTNNAAYLNKQLISWTTFMNLGIDIHNYIKRHIDQGYYIQFQVDEYYTPNSWRYEDKHNIHDMFVYGYDDEKELYNVLCYNRQLIFEENTCPYKQFEAAFKNNYLDKKENFWADRIYFYQYNENDHYSFNTKLVKNSLVEYLCSMNSFETLNRFYNQDLGLVYGIDVFDKILEHLSIVKEIEATQTKRGEPILDPRIFRFLKEHKKIMMMRMEYINEHITDVKELIMEYKEAERIAEKSHNVAIKYMISPNTNLLDMLYVYVEQLKKIDQIVLAKLVVKL